MDYKKFVFCNSGTESVLKAIRIAKAISKKATEVHGGMGFTDLLGLHYWFKRIGLNRQLLGGPELVREEAAEIQGFNQ